MYLEVHFLQQESLLYPQLPPSAVEERRLDMEPQTEWSLHSDIEVEVPVLMVLVTNKTK